MGIIGSALIWQLGTGTVTRTMKFWVPAQVKYVNDVDGTYLDMSNFITTHPVATITLEDFRRIAEGRETLIAISNGYAEPNVHVIRVRYTTTVNGVQYYTSSDFNWWRKDSSTWQKDGTVTFMGHLFGGAVVLIILWWVLTGWLCLFKDTWLRNAYTSFRKWREK